MRKNTIARTPWSLALFKSGVKGGMKASPGNLRGWTYEQHWRVELQHDRSDFDVSDSAMRSSIASCARLDMSCGRTGSDSG